MRRWNDSCRVLLDVPHATQELAAVAEEEKGGTGQRPCLLCIKNNRRAS